MESTTKEYVVRNSLSYAYDALRSKERLMGESTTSFYEHFFHQLADSLALPGKRCEVSIGNSEVESFYLGKISLGEFRMNAQKRYVASQVCSYVCSLTSKASLRKQLPPFPTSV